MVTWGCVEISHPASIVGLLFCIVFFQQSVLQFFLYVYVWVCQSVHRMYL